MERRETLLAAFVKDADQVDDGIGACDRRRQPGVVEDVGAQPGDLPDIAHRLEKQGGLDVAHDCGDARAARGKALHDITSNETGGADDGDATIPHLS